MGHRRRQLCHLPKPHHGSLHRVPGEPSVRYERGVHRCLGYLQSRVPLPLHFKVAQGPASLPAGQQGLGIPEIRSVGDPKAGAPRRGGTIQHFYCGCGLAQLVRASGGSVGASWDMVLQHGSWAQVHP